MIKDQENHISYEQWKELTARDIFIYEDEKPRALSRLYDLFGDEFDEESSRSKPQKNKIY